MKQINPTRLQIALALLLSLTAANVARSQELEPRAFANLPVGTSFALLGYVYASGNSLLDPALSIEGLEARLHTVAAAYFRSIDLFGHSGKVDIILPFAGSDYEGTIAGRDSTTARTGFGDPRIRLSVNFLGAPALSSEEFREYQQQTIFGASVQVVIPIGQYDPDRLLNLGSNRWIFRTQVGASRKTGLWTWEAYGGAWFFTENPDFLGELDLSQKPLLVGKVHAIRALPKGYWVAFGAGYGFGGEVEVNGVPRESHISSFRFGLTVSVPLSPNHQLKFVGATTARIERGSDTDILSVFYQFRWGSGL
jgi:hypothetical protein